ncbi:hypothetical protein E6C76_03590 [Pseudothauera nasutitermitis]|uniref:Uncharacterized protein n=1 Tax=Pseudothauera nasutitermitis TaxID=2565930 RepID=A0A4S4B483_9RHOO|nr:hypothetical protein [Pseudothauera nasutitermitis]THF67459.1 hypothetical protein E6C76_03590 [Pseudothauera nasutitermitis]
MRTTTASATRLLAAAGLALALSAAHAQLSPAAQRDLLELRMVEAVKTERYADFLKHLAEFRGADGTVGAEMRYYEGVALEKAGQPLEARAALEAFIAQAGREHALYAQALSRYDALEQAASAAARERERARALLDAPLLRAMERAPRAVTVSALPSDTRWLGGWNYEWYAGERQNGLHALPGGGWLAYGHRPTGTALDAAKIDGSWPRLDLPQLPPAALRSFAADGQPAWLQVYDFNRIWLRSPSSSAPPSLDVVTAAMFDSGHAVGEWGSHGYLVPGRPAHQGHPEYFSAGWRSEIVRVAADATGELRICANLQLGAAPKRAGLWAWVDAQGTVADSTAWGMPQDHPEGAFAGGRRYWFDSGLDDCAVLPDGALLVAGRAVRTAADGGLGKAHEADKPLRALRIFERDGSLRASLLLQTGTARRPDWWPPARLEAGSAGEGWEWLWGQWRIDTRAGLSATPRQPGADEAVAELLAPASGADSHRLRVAGREHDLIAADLAGEVALAQAGRLADGSVLALLNLSFPKDLHATVLADGQRLDADLWLDRQPLAVLAAFDAGGLQWALPLRHGNKASIDDFARKAAEAARQNPASGFVIPPDHQIREYAGNQGYRFGHWAELADGRVLVGTGGGLTYALQRQPAAAQAQTEARP